MCNSNADITVDVSWTLDHLPSSRAFQKAASSSAKKPASQDVQHVLKLQYFAFSHFNHSKTHTRYDMPEYWHIVTFCIRRLAFLLPSPIPDTSGDGVLFWIDFFVCFFVSKITRKRLDQFARNFQRMCAVTMGRPDYIFGQFRETAQRCDVQLRDGVCCAFAPQLVYIYMVV